MFEFVCLSHVIECHSEFLVRPAASQQRELSGTLGGRYILRVDRLVCQNVRRSSDVAGSVHSCADENKTPSRVILIFPIREEVVMHYTS